MDHLDCIKLKRDKMKNENDILAQKRAWKNGDPDRRSARRLAADLLRAQREHEKKLQHLEKPLERNALIMAICMILAVLMMVFFAKASHADMIQPERLANAIYKAEGGTKTKWPYGIKHHYKHTTARKACINTINHRLKLWNGQGDFIVYLGQTYSPPLINPNWVRMVKSIYQDSL